MGQASRQETFTDAERERLLQASEARFRAMIERSGEGITLVAADGTTLYASPSCQAVLGYSPDELVGSNAFTIMHPDDFPRMRPLADDLLKVPGASVTVQYRARHKDGAWRWIEVTGTNLLDDPNVGAVVANFRDVTERIRTEDALREANEHLRQAFRELEAAQQQVIQQERLRALGEMAAGIAHDLNNALAPVVGYTELMLHAPHGLEDRDQTRRYLELIHTGAYDASSVVRRLREFYRPRESQDVLEVVDVCGIAEQVIALTRPKWRDQAQAEGRTITIVPELAPVPPIAGSEAEVREALTNLIFNAVDALPHGGAITVRTYADEGRRTKDQVVPVGGDSSSVVRPSSSARGRSVVLEVQDTGVGMTDEVRRRCQEPFFSTKGTQGSGLGLSLVHGTVRRHGGRVELRSAPGAGTTVRLRFPVASSRQPGVPTDAPSAAARRLRVLVVDDEPAVRTVTCAYFVADGHHADGVAGGEEALAALRRAPYDLLVTDRSMPGMTGEQLAIAARSEFPKLPIFLLTGFGDLMNEAGERPEHVDLILSKPLTLTRLREALARF